MNGSRFKSHFSGVGPFLRVFPFVLSLLFLSSCGVPEELDTFSEDTVTVVEDIGEEIGKERKINDDIIVTPAKEEKVKIRF